MKNIMIISTTAILVISGLSAFDKNQTMGDLSVQVEQTKVPTNTNAPAEQTVREADVKDAPRERETNFVSDHDLSKAIYKAIREDRIFTTDSKAKVEVSVYNGKVTLSGTVTTEAEKARAEFLATQLNKLQSVVNNIKVEP